MSGAVVKNTLQPTWEDSRFVARDHPEYTGHMRSHDPELAAKLLWGVLSITLKHAHSLKRSELT